jgi:hypothetical protein
LAAASVAGLLAVAVAGGLGVVAGGLGDVAGVLRAAAVSAAGLGAVAVSVAGVMLAAAGLATAVVAGLAVPVMALAASVTALAASVTGFVVLVAASGGVDVAGVGAAAVGVGGAAAAGVGSQQAAMIAVAGSHLPARRRALPMQAARFGAFKPSSPHKTGLPGPGSSMGPPPCLRPHDSSVRRHRAYAVMRAPRARRPRPMRCPHGWAVRPGGQWSRGRPDGMVAT